MGERERDWNAPYQFKLSTKKLLKFDRNSKRDWRILKIGGVNSAKNLLKFERDGLPFDDAGDVDGPGGEREGVRRFIERQRRTQQWQFGSGYGSNEG